MYCSQQDMIDRFGEDELIQRTDRSNIGVIDSAVLDRAIADASAEIDSYLSKYTLPLSVIPAVLVRACCDMARFYIYDDMVPDVVDARYASSLKFLTQVAKGVINVGPDDTGASPATNNSATMQSGGRVFGRSDNGFL